MTYIVMYNDMHTYTHRCDIYNIWYVYISMFIDIYTYFKREENTLILIVALSEW